MVRHPERRWQSGRLRLAVNQVPRARWFESIPAHQASMVQWIGRQFPELEIAGSSPAGSAEDRMTEWRGSSLQNCARRFDSACGLTMVFRCGLIVLPGCRASRRRAGYHFRRGGCRFESGSMNLADHHPAQVQPRGPGGGRGPRGERLHHRRAARRGCAERRGDGRLAAEGRFRVHPLSQEGRPRPLAMAAQVAVSIAVKRPGQSNLPGRLAAERWWSGRHVSRAGTLVAVAARRRSMRVVRPRRS
jgi:hypothetical protein